MRFSVILCSRFPCPPVQTQLVKICTKFGKASDVDLDRTVNGCLFCARITIVEFYMVFVLLKHNDDRDAAVKGINAQVRAFIVANIRPVRDLHKAVWCFSDMMIKAQKFEQ